MLRMIGLGMFIMLLIGGIMTAGAGSGSGKIDRVIKAERSVVFDVINDPAIFAPLRKVSDTGDRILYEAKLEGELASLLKGEASRDFTGGTMAFIVEPDARMTMQMASRDGDTRLRWKLAFADTEDKKATRVTSTIEVDDPTIDDAEEARRENAISSRPNPFLDSLIKRIEVLARHG